jgi:hypothetical protein
MKKTLSVLIIMVVYFFLAQSAQAVNCVPPCGTGFTCNTRVGECLPSSGGVNSGSAVTTALGSTPTQPEELVKWILGWGVTLGGGIAFLLSLWGGITIILAGGNPEKINEGKEIITSAVSGLLFIIFSVFLLRLIGVDILGIL